jgi:hypothetical protein
LAGLLPFLLSDGLTQQISRLPGSGLRDVCNAKAGKKAHLFRTGGHFAPDGIRIGQGRKPGCFFRFVHRRVSFLQGENDMSDHRRDNSEGSGSWLKADERKTLAHAYATLFNAGYRRFEPGCRLVYYTGLLFVYYEDPLCDRQMRLTMLKNYQETLSKKGIKVELCDDPGSDPYLCG